MNDSPDLPEMAPLAHGVNLDLPCFACFLNDLVLALNEVYADGTPGAYEAAMSAAVQQVADGMARLFLAGCEDADGLRTVFNERIGAQMLLLSLPADAARAH